MNASGLRFGRFELQPQARRLLVDGHPEPLGGRAFDLLLALVASPGRLVTKQQLMAQVWPDVIVEDSNLTAQVFALRKVLGGDVIRTVPGRGYQFAAALASTVGAAAPPLPSAAPAEAPFRTNLPAVLPAIIGRDADLATLAALVAQHRLVTLVGTGGVGKTLLAQHLLARQRHQHAHGVCWADLSTVADAQRLPAAVAAALGLRIGGSDALAALAAALAPLSMLLALDNAEHLAAPLAAALDQLLPQAPGVRVVVTSQEPLKARGEWRCRLAPLACPAGDVTAREALGHGAVALFDERARAADQRFVLTDANAGTVAAICRQLDGSALAIELAAARLPLLGLAGLQRALHDRFRVLTAGVSSAPARQRTLRAAVSWSHGLLNAAEQTVFRRLAVFVGAADLDLVGDVIGDVPADAGLDRWAVLDALGGLVDHSLVAIVDGPVPRYRLLETPRAYAAERLAESGETEALRRRHALALAGRCASRLGERFQSGVDLAQRHREIDAELEDARAAFAWATEHDAPAAVALGSLLLGALKSHGAAEQQAVAQALEAGVRDDQPAWLRGRAWRELAWWYLPRARQRRPSELAARAVAAFRAEAGLRDHLYMALQILASALSVEDDLPGARRAVAEMAALEDPAWPPSMRSFRAQVQAQVATHAGDFDTAIEAARRNVVLAQAAGDTGIQAVVNLADLELVAGHVDAAVCNGSLIVEQLRASRHRDQLAMALINLVAAAVWQGDLALARRHAHEVWPAALRFGLHGWWADHLALLAARDARVRAAACLAGYADAAYGCARMVRQASERNSLERALAIAVSILGEPAVERLRAEGALLPDDEVPALALGRIDAP